MLFNFFHKKKKKIGLALSGGVARGFVHIGVLKAFDTFKIPIHFISGSSVGALIASLYACGISAQKMVAISESISWKQLVKIKLSRHGMFSAEAIEKLVTNYIGNKTFDETQIPLSIAMTDILNDKKVIVSKGSLTIAKVVSASTCIPGVFSPVNIDDNYYIDGSVKTFLPVHCLRELGATHIVGVNIIPKKRLQELPKSMYHVLDRAVDCMLNSMKESIDDRVDIMLEPVENYVSSLDIKSYHKLIDFGFQSVEKNKCKIQDLV